MPAFTIAEAARHCGVDRRTLQRAIRSGRLALTPEHRLTPDALAQAGYSPVAVPEEDAAEAPHLSTAAAPQEPPQELTQATALLALLESLTTALGDLHAEVRALRAPLRQTPQRRRRGAPGAQTTPHQGAAPMPQETPQEVRHTAAAPQHAPATAAPPKPPTRQPRATTPPTLETLPAHIRRIAEAREQYERLTLRDFAQLLYDRDIYRTKDGGVVNAGTLHRWLEKAGM